VTPRRLGERGTTAVEFAMLAPLMLILSLGVIEVGIQGAVSVALNLGARNASRLGTTGTIGATGVNGAIASDAARLDAVRSKVLEPTGSFLVDGNLTVTQTAFGKVADLPSTAYPNGQNGVTGPGAAGRFVQYTFTYAQRTFSGDLTAFLTAYFGNASAIPKAFVHKSTILVTNEPFQN